MKHIMCGMNTYIRLKLCCIMDKKYLNKVVSQLVSETEIDFKNRRVSLETCGIWRPFYSFGASRSNIENFITVPPDFSKYVISNYGLSGVETKEVWILYIGTVSARLKYHDENVNHLGLHESHEYNGRGKPTIKKQITFFNNVVDMLVDGTEVIIHDIPFNDRDGEIIGRGPYIKPPFLNHDQYEPEEDILFYDFSFFGYNFKEYMYDIFGFNDNEILTIWAPYYRSLQKKVEDAIERDRVTYGED